MLVIDQAILNNYINTILSLIYYKCITGQFNPVYCRVINGKLVQSENILAEKTFSLCHNFIFIVMQKCNTIYLNKR